MYYLKVKANRSPGEIASLQLVYNFKMEGLTILTSLLNWQGVHLM